MLYLEWSWTLKFDSKSDTGAFLGYSNNSKAYHVFNMRMQTFMESVNVVVDDSCDFSKFSKEDVISSLNEETGEEGATGQLVTTPSNIGSDPSKSVAIANKPNRYCETCCNRRWSRSGF